MDLVAAPPLTWPDPDFGDGILGACHNSGLGFRWNFIGVQTSFLNHFKHREEEQRIEDDAHPYDIRLYPAGFLHGQMLLRMVSPGLLLDRRDVLTAMPIIDIIRRRSGYDAPDHAARHVPRQVGGNHGPYRVHGGIEIHLPIEKPQKRDEQKGWPVPG